MTESHSIITHIPDCPRCGYPLQGLPLPPQGVNAEGRCPECGLEFDWAVLLDPLYAAPKWFVELDHSDLLMNSLRTTTRSLGVPSFWRAVHMGLPRRTGRAVACAMIGFIAVWLVLSLIGMMNSIVFSSMATPMRGSMALKFVDELSRSPVRAVLISILPQNMGLAGSAWMIATYLAYLAAPFSMLLLPETLKRAEVLPGHLLRIALYSLAPSLVLAAVPSAIRSIWWSIDVVVYGNPYSRAGAEFMFGNSWWVRPGMAFLAIMLTWGFACSRYLKLPAAWLTAGLMALISVLFGVVLTVFSNDSFELFGGY